MSIAASVAREPARRGTQSIERAVRLLREVSSRGDFGWQLADLAARCEMDKGTAHRILACLSSERLVRQRASDGHYMPGPMLFELGLSVSGFGDLQHKARTLLAALARRTGSVGFLFFRSGDDFVCAVRVGKSEVKAFTGFPGSRKALIASAGGAAILLALSRSEARAIIRRNLHRQSNLSKERVRAYRSMLQRSRAAGFGFNVGDLLPGVNSFAIALSDSAGRPFGSIMLAAEARALPLNRSAEIKKALQAVAEELTGHAP